MKSNKLAIIFSAGVLLLGFNVGVNADDKVSGDSPPNVHDYSHPAKTRAQVSTELKAAREQGLLYESNDGTLPVTPSATSSRSRAEVRQEAIKANRSQSARAAYDNLYGG